MNRAIESDRGRERRALLVVNPNSRSGGGDMAPAIARLQKGGINIVARHEGTPAELESAIAKAGSLDCVLVGGGDGTLNACIEAIMAAGLPLGVLPLGTGNDLARTLSIPLDLPGAVDVILSGYQTRIDVGDVNGIAFLNVASIGMSARLAEELTADVKRRFGALGYLLAALRILSKAHPFQARIIGPQGGVKVTTLQVAVGNGRHYGAGMTVAADARIDDQLLDLYSIETHRVWRIALMARALRTGRHIEWPDVRAGRATHFTIETKHPMPVNVDGELLTQTPACFTLRPLALAVYVPEARTGSSAF